MKPSDLSALNYWGRAFLLAIAFCQAANSLPGATDPTLRVSYSRAEQANVLSWAGANAVPYQVQAGSDLADWTNVSPVITGNGSTLSFTNPVSGETCALFRVVRLFPAASGSAAFDPATGLLTVVGDEQDNTITIGRDSAGVLLVNDGAMPVTGGVATVTNTLLIQVLGLAGNDQITIMNGLPPAHLFGDAGNDTLNGGSSADLLVGGPGNDVVRGGQGNDVAYLGEGDDTFVWNPGDGSDVVEGEAGNDTLQFNASNASEHIDLSANGSRFLLMRDVGGITLDLDGIEQVNLPTLGGTDNVTINSLAGTALAQVTVDLFGAGGVGDAQADNVIIAGTAGPDTINIAANGAAVEVTGLGALVRVVNAEPANDRVVVNGVGGDRVNVNGTDGADTIQVLPSPVTNCVRVVASGFTAPVDVTGALTLSVNGLGGADTLTAANGLATIGIPLILDGGDGDDVISGGDGNDVLLGGPGNDVLNGNRGNDVILAGEGDDTIIWDPGDGSDVVEGEGGNDILAFNGSNAGEHISLAANGTRLQFTRDVGAVVQDVNGVERVDFRALGGADVVAVHDLTGTAVSQVNVDLGSSAGVGDGSADSVTVDGTAGLDTISITANAGAVEISGLTAQVRLLHPELIDTLTVNGLDGTDSIGVGAGVTSLVGVVTNP